MTLKNSLIDKSAKNIYSRLKNRSKNTQISRVIRDQRSSAKKMLKYRTGSADWSRAATLCRAREIWSIFCHFRGEILRRDS
jgi:hypothetical protein